MKGCKINIPKNYFKDNNPTEIPVVKWRAHASLLYNNWINMVYQNTPFNMEDIGK